MNLSFYRRQFYAVSVVFFSERNMPTSIDPIYTPPSSSASASSDQHKYLSNLVCVYNLLPAWVKNTPLAPTTPPRRPSSGYIDIHPMHVAVFPPLHVAPCHREHGRANPVHEPRVTLVRSPPPLVAPRVERQPRRGRRRGGGRGGGGGGGGGGDGGGCSLGSRGVREGTSRWGRDRITPRSDVCR